MNQKRVYKKIDENEYSFVDEKYGMNVVLEFNPDRSNDEQAIKNIIQAAKDIARQDFYFLC